MLTYFHSLLILLFSPPSVCFLFFLVRVISQLDGISDANDKLFKSSNDLANAQQQTNSKVLLAPQKNLASESLAGVGGDNDVRRSHIAQHLVVNGRERTAKNKTTQLETQQQDESQDEQDESSPSKNVEGVFLRHRHTIAQPTCADIVVGPMSAPTTRTVATINVEILSTTNENTVPNVSKNKE